MKKSSLRIVLGILVFCCFLQTAECRDWLKDPARIDVPCAPRVVVVGDVHGAFAEVTASLAASGVARQTTPEGFQLEWTGGKTVLIFTGDLTDRGKHTKEVYDAVMTLEESSRKAGGQVIALFGNHEALLLNGTTEKWAKTLKPPKQQHYQNTLDSFTKAGLDFHQAISPTGKYGAWIRRRPLFAVVNGFLFIHGGLPSPSQSLSDIAADYHESMDAGDFNKGIFMAETGPLWNREWWNDKALVDDNLQKMGVRGVIFGHTIGAIGTPGKISAQDRRIISIDVGMCPAYGNSKGGALLITIDPDGKMTFTATYPDFPAEELFKVPAPNLAPLKRKPANEQLPRTGTAN